MATVNVENFEIHVKGGFSERKGVKYFSDIVQTNDLNKRTRNRLYSATDEIFEKLGSNHSYQINLKDYFVEYLYKDVFSKTVRDIPMWGNDYDRVFDLIYVIFEQYNYTDVFTFIEGIIRFLKITDKATYYSYEYKNEYIESISNIFEHENVNYRIINDLITDILGKALNSLKIQIHYVLKSAYSNIYGYTSDENGTRHANGIGEKMQHFQKQNIC